MAASSSSTGPTVDGFRRPRCNASPPRTRSAAEASSPPPADIYLVHLHSGREEVPNVRAKAKKIGKVMNWTPPMSACMMRCLTDIAAKGVKIDKGFKEIHITQAAKVLTQHVGYEVSDIQITNHLCTWKVRYQRIEKLRAPSGALWDDDTKMIVLEEQHYLVHIQDTPKDAEFLNKPLVNFDYMEACFANKLATGKFAMGSNEPLGKPLVVEHPGNGQQTSGEGIVQVILLGWTLMFIPLVQLLLHLLAQIIRGRGHLL